MNAHAFYIENCLLPMSLQLFTEHFGFSDRVLVNSLTIDRLLIITWTVLVFLSGGNPHQYIRRLSPNEVQLVKVNLTWEDNDTYYCRAGPLRNAVALIVQGEVKG